VEDEREGGLFCYDLAKAYDRLHWSFIYHTLMEIGYPMEWIDVVMTSITSVINQGNVFAPRYYYR
jgi:hypothetical protein